VEECFRLVNQDDSRISRQSRCEDAYVCFDAIAVCRYVLSVSVKRHGAIVHTPLLERVCRRSARHSDVELLHRGGVDGQKFTERLVGEPRKPLPSAIVAEQSRDMILRRIQQASGRRIV
jgi:hypothetical protein